MRNEELLQQLAKFDPGQEVYVIVENGEFTYEIIDTEIHTSPKHPHQRIIIRVKTETP